MPTTDDSQQKHMTNILVARGRGQVNK